MLRSIFKNTILSLNLLFALLMLISIVSARVSPADFPIMTYFAFLYPFLAIANIVFAIIWALRLNKWFFLSFFLLLISWRQLSANYQISILGRNQKNEGSAIRLITYNVRAFNQFNWAHDKTAKQQMLKFISERDPDVVCLQEFYTSDIGINSIAFINIALKRYKYRHIYYTTQKRNANYGLAIYSKYKIIKKEKLSFGKTNNITIYSDIVVNKDTLRIYNNHLQSIHLLKKHYDLFDSLSLDYKLREDQISSLHSRFIEASRQRAVQSDMIAKSIKSCKYKVIVCGDFNDTPSSYTYNRIRGKLKDAFVESGTGAGGTYFGIIPSFRIDYIFHSKQITSYKYTKHNLPLSDHLPLECSFTWGKKK